MQFTIAAIAAFAASASAAALNTTAPAGPVYVTEVVTHLTTFCPGATVITAGSHTITVSSATTLTIEDCSCTQTILSTPAAATAPVATGPHVTGWSNGTAAATSSAAAAVGTGGAAAGTAAHSAHPSAFTGAASLNTLSGAAAALALAAFAL